MFCLKEGTESSLFYGTSIWIDFIFAKVDANVTNNIRR